MPKLTKQETKFHDEAEALLSLERPLTPDEVDFIYNNWREDARHLNVKTAAHFTPPDVAWELAVFASGYDRLSYVDLGAGIGILSHMVLRHTFENADITCVELNPDYVEVGKRLLPDVNWVQGDMFDKDLWVGLGDRFDTAISNPPFGSPTSKTKGKEWLSSTAAHFATLEVALHVSSGFGVFVFPESDSPMVWRSGGSVQPANHLSSHYRRFNEHYPQAVLTPSSTDIGIYKNQWRGVNPNVMLVDLLWEDSPDPLPSLAHQMTLM